MLKLKNMNRPKYIMWIDRGSRYIGLARMAEGETTPMPVGYIENDAMAYYTIAEHIVRYKVSTIVVWYPKRQEDVQKKIDKFIRDLTFIIDAEKTQIVKMDEDYSTVEAGEIVSNFKKNVASDTVSAMVILDRWVLEMNG